MAHGKKNRNRPRPPVAQRAANSSQQVAVASRQELFQGPLPHPKHLEEFERVCPGSAERIVCMAEKEQAHRHALEEREMRIAARAVPLGQVFALVIVLGGFAATCVLAVYGKSLMAWATILAALATIVGGLRYGRKAANNE